METQGVEVETQGVESLKQYQDMEKVGKSFHKLRKGLINATHCTFSRLSASLFPLDRVSVNKHHKYLNLDIVVMFLLS